MTVNIDFQFPDLGAAMKSREGEINLFLAATIQTNRGLLFDSEGHHNGRPGWAPLKFRRGQILSDRGVLRKSIAPYSADGKPGPNGIVQIQPDAITIGTTLLYAALMNYGTTKMPGGVLRPKYAKALKIPIPGGANATPVAKAMRKGAKTLSYDAADGVKKSGKFIFRKFVRIPARPFNDWNERDQEELDAALINKIAKVMNDG
jgi:phage gpG-like protein